MAYIINDSNKTNKFVDGSTIEDINSASVHIESESDLTGLPDEIPIGSLAYTTAFAKVWQKDFDGSWVEVVLK